MKIIKILPILLLTTFLLTSLPAVAFGDDELIEVRIGWQVPWATQGQLVQILKHTDILKNNGLSAIFVGRTYGPVLNEIALAGDIDVVLTADQPAVALFSKNKGWIGIARLMYNRTSTYVPLESPIQSIHDLKSKTIGIPIGAAAERVTLQALSRIGIDPKKDVRIVNLGIREQAPLIQKWMGSSTWGDIDALSGFDPSPAIFEANGMVRVLDVGKVCSLVLMNEAFLSLHPKVGKRFVSSLIDAYDYYRKNSQKANEWFINEARLKDCNQKACNIAASIEPNVWCSSKKDIRVHFIEDDYKIIEEAAEFLSPRLGRLIKVRQFVTNKYASEFK